MLVAPRRDRLDAVPAVERGIGRPWTGLVIVDLGKAGYVNATADVMRRVAVTLDHGGRKGAALDLLNACDLAEALAADLQSGVH